jgi:hypothetical protein
MRQRQVQDGTLRHPAATQHHTSQRQNPEWREQHYKSIGEAYEPASFVLLHTLHAQHQPRIDKHVCQHNVDADSAAVLSSKCAAAACAALTCILPFQSPWQLAASAQTPHCSDAASPCRSSSSSSNGADIQQ